MKPDRKIKWNISEYIADQYPTMDPDMRDDIVRAYDKAFQLYNNIYDLYGKGFDRSCKILLNNALLSNFCRGKFTNPDSLKKSYMYITDKGSLRVNLDKGLISLNLEL